MKFRLERNQERDDAERALEGDVRRLVSAEGRTGNADPPETYWQNQVVRANQSIDEATSGKALSILWAARVAVPGVVAIISFFIGLHYYVPEPPRENVSVATVVLSLPVAEVDSLLLHPETVDPALSVADYGTDVFDVSREQITDYLLASGNATAAVEGLSEKETSQLLAALGNDPR